MRTVSVQPDFERDSQAPGGGAIAITHMSCEAIRGFGQSLHFEPRSHKPSPRVTDWRKRWRPHPQLRNNMVVALTPVINIES